MKNIDYKIAIKLAILLVIALLSICVVSKRVSSPEFHEATIESLDEKRTTVMELTAASAAASSAITLLPGDAATPIAEQLADLSSYFLVVICALYLEKYLVTVTGYAAFTWLLPIACFLLAAYVVFRRKALRTLAVKLIAFGLAIVVVVPASVKLSDMIETTYQSSIEQTIESAKDATELIEVSAAEETEEEEGFFHGIVSKVKEGVSDATAKVENVLNRFIEALAVMIVTSCLIPVLVLVFLVWLVKNLLGTDLSLTKEKETKQ